MVGRWPVLLGVGLFVGGVCAPSAAHAGDVLASVQVLRPVDGFGGDGQFGDPSVALEADTTASTVEEAADGTLSVSFENADGGLVVAVDGDSVVVTGDGPALELETAAALRDGFDPLLEPAVLDAVDTAIDAVVE